MKQNLELTEVRKSTNQPAFLQKWAQLLAEASLPGRRDLAFFECILSGQYRKATAA
jgi:hypothetical protein